MPTTRGNGKNCVDSTATGEAAQDFLEKARMRAAMAKAHNQLKNQDSVKPNVSKGALAITPAKPAAATEAKGTPGGTSTKSMLAYIRNPSSPVTSRFLAHGYKLIKYTYMYIYICIYV